MSRRWKIALWIIGPTVVIVGGLAIALLLSSPPVSEPSFDVVTREIPSDWSHTDAASDGDPIEEVAPLAEEPLAEPSKEAAPAPFVSTGSLAIIGDGKPFGEEIYELTISEDQATLRSSGRFWFKIVVATVNVTFEQTLEAKGDLRPVMYVAEFHAPLGFDRSIRATVKEDNVTIEQSDKTEQIPIDPENTFTLGTFSTYVLLPRLFALRHTEDTASFEVLVFGGPPNQESRDQAPGEDASLPTMTIERMGMATLRAGEIFLDVDCYSVSSDLGQSELFSRGDEFLAFRAGDEDNPLWVYRSDFFPNGVEVVDLTSFR